MCWSFGSRGSSGPVRSRVSSGKGKVPGSLQCTGGEGSCGSSHAGLPVALPVCNCSRGSPGTRF